MEQAIRLRSEMAAQIGFGREGGNSKASLICLKGPIMNLCQNPVLPVDRRTFR